MSQLTGICILSIELNASSEPLTSQTDALSGRLEDLRDRLAQAGLAVTWGVGAKHPFLGEALLAQSVDSEVALHAGPEWSREGSTRRQFANGLAHAVSQFEAAGLDARTLLLPQGRPALYDDLLVKHGIRVVRVGRRSEVRARRWGWRAGSNPQLEPLRSVRWGLWEAAVSANLARDGESTVVRMIDRVSRTGGLAVAVADAELLTANERLASRLISRVVRRRGDAVLRIETFASLAETRQTCRSTPSARSVLRPAA
ncbi:MAG: hypothetical protein ACREHD_29610 [Pirellulales bacterium]